MNRNAAKSLPRRERRTLAMAVVTNRASVMQNSTSSSTAATATSTPSGPLASPTVDPSRPSTLASGQRPGAQRVEGQRGRVEGAVEAEGEQRQRQPPEREQGKGDRGHVHRRA